MKESVKRDVEVFSLVTKDPELCDNKVVVLLSADGILVVENGDEIFNELDRTNDKDDGAGEALDSVTIIVLEGGLKEVIESEKGKLEVLKAGSRVGELLVE